MGDESAAGAASQDGGRDGTLIAACSDSAPPVLRRVARMIRGRAPELVLFAGDARAEGFGISPLRSIRWRAAWGALARRVITVPGNHDFRPRSNAPWVWNGRWEAAPTFSRHVSGAFVLVLPRVIVLGFSTGRTAGIISQEHVDWAVAQIPPSATTTCRIAVFHAPAFPVSEHIGSSLDADPRSRDRLWASLERIGVDVVINGHEHLYARRVIERSRAVTQIITGGAGAETSPLLSSDVLASHAGAHAFLLDVSEAGLRGRALTLAGDVVDQFHVANSRSGPRPAPAFRGPGDHGTG